VAAQERDGASGLWSANQPARRTAMNTALLTISLLLDDASNPPVMTCVARSGHVEFWRADFSNATIMHVHTCDVPYQWRRPEEMVDKSQWHCPHFESLEHFGVWCGQGRGAIFSAPQGPVLQSGVHVASLHTMSGDACLVEGIKAVVQTGGVLIGVLETVTDSEDNFFRNLFLDSNKVLCYQQAEDVRARVCMPGKSREAVLQAAHVDSVLVGHPGIDRTYAAIAHAYRWPNFFADVLKFMRSCSVCAAA